MNHPRIVGIGTANPPVRLTQEQSSDVTGYESERIRKIFPNSDIDYHPFYLECGHNRNESSDELNQRYLRAAVHIGCRGDSELSELLRFVTSRRRFSSQFAPALAMSAPT